VVFFANRILNYCFVVDGSFFVFYILYSVHAEYVF